MGRNLIRHGFGLIALALLMRGPQATATDASSLPASTANAMAQAVSPQAIAEYRRKLAEYQEIHGAFEQEAGAYWQAITDKRRGRNAQRRDHQPIDPNHFVLTQPP